MRIQDYIISAVDEFSIEQQYNLLSQAKKEDVIDALNALVNNPSLKAYLELSYKHQGGFDKYLLSRDKFGRELRVHVWWPDHFANFIYPPHSHRWGFQSKVVLGMLIENRFNKIGLDQSGPNNYFEYEYSINQKNADSTTKELGKTKLAKIREDKYQEGSIYRISSNEIHSTFSNLTTPTITLCFTGVESKASTSVYHSNKRNKIETHTRGVSRHQNITSSIKRAIHALSM